MKLKIYIVNVVKDFAKQIGVPMSLILDPQGTQTSKKLNKVMEDICYSMMVFLERRI